MKRQITPGMLFASLIVAALSLTWILIFREFLLDKIRLFNILGIETNLFLLIVLSVIILILSYFGLAKRGKLI